MPRRAVPGREDLPLVSVVLPVLNEEAHIQRCLASVQAQDYPAEMIEIVVADGGSTDRTRAIVERIAASDRRISLVDNPGRNQAAGLNRAIAASTGTIVARLDGHAAWPPSHISRCVQLLETTGADNVTVNLRGNFRSIFGSLAVSFIGLLGVFFVSPYRITRPTLLLWVPIAAAALLGWRLCYRKAFAQEIFAGSLAVVADFGRFQSLWPDATGVMSGLYRVVEVVNPDRPDCADMLRELATEGRVDQIILGVKEDMSRELFRVLLECYDRGVPVRSLSDLYEELTGRMLLDQLGHSWLLSLPMRSETSRIYIAFKRAFDILAALAGLLFLGILAPFIWIAVQLEDRGPLIYRQERLGKYARPFTIFKLRTMHQERRAKQRQTGAGDLRITRVGGLLRKLHIDELPQAWNILKGEMSMIGPRPEQPAYVATLQEAIDFYNTRLSVRPGLTGWAQVNLGYGEGVDGAREKLSYDLYYIKRQSPALDLLILARTFTAVLSLSGR